MPESGTSSRSPRLLLCGGGHAMLPSMLEARAWIEEGASVTLINDHRYLYYSGMVPEYLGGVYEADEVRIDLEALCAKVGLPFLQTRAERLDAPACILHIADGAPLEYDLLAFDVGARNPGEPGEAFPTKPLHAIESFERRLDAALEESAESFHLVIVGAGAAGVEIALNVTARFAAHNRSDRLSIHLIERASTLLPGFPDAMQDHVQQRLTERDVAILLDASVTEVTPDGVHIANQPFVPADAVLWATGSTGPSLFRASRLPCDGRGFLRVNTALQSLADPRIFAAGDCATVEGYDDLARIGVHAVKQGPVLRDNLTQALHALTQNERPDAASLMTFQPYPIAPLILSTGVRQGVWVSGPWWLRGRPLLRLKHYVDRHWIRQYAPEAWSNARLLDLLRAEAAYTSSR